MSVLLGLHQVFGRLRQACQPPAGAVDQLPLALADLDNSGRIRRINRGWSELTGYVARHSLNCLLDDFLPPAERETWALAMQRMRGMAPLNTEVLLLRRLIRTGESRWVEARLRRLADGFIVSLADVSGQMQWRHYMQTSHRSLSHLLDGLPMMVYRCRNNRHWSMEYVSAGCLELTGYPAERLVNSRSLTFDSLIHVEDRDRVWAEVQAGLVERGPFAFKYRLLCADGRHKPVLERGSGIYSENGGVLGLEGVVLELPR